MDKKVSIAPYANISKSPALQMFFVWVAICPQITMLFFTKNFSSLAIILCAILGAFCSHLCDIIEKKNIFFCVSHSFLTGTLIGFFLPQTYPPTAVFFLTFVLMVAEKNILGPQGISWLNPAVLVLSVAWVSGAFNFPEINFEKNVFLSKNPSLFLIDDSFAKNPFDQKITFALNSKIFSLLNFQIPQGYVALFWDDFSQIPAFRFCALTLLASAFLFAFDLQNASVSFAYILTYALLVKFASPFFTGAKPFSGDLIFALFSGGTLFSAFFLLQWQGTTPYSKTAKIIWAAFGGIFAFVFCGAGMTFCAPSFFSILFLNLFSPAFCFFENEIQKKKVARILTEEGLL